MESEYNSNDIVNLIAEKNRGNLQSGIISSHSAIGQAHRLISVFKDALEVDEIVSMLSENNVDITSAHVELLCKFYDNSRVIGEDNFDFESDRVCVAKHLKKSFSVIPIDDNPRFLSSYYKDIFKKYINTLTYLLKFKESWQILIETSNDLKIIVEYFKQEGLWTQWLEIARLSIVFCDGSVLIELLRSKAWIYF